jgi:hypothetical protein
MTLLENYKRSVRTIRPGAQLQYVRDEDGFRWYRIVVGKEILSDDEGSATAAWRNAHDNIMSGTI